MNVGELVGRGRTSDVYSYGDHDVVKVPHANVPDDWPEFEASITNAIGQAGAPAPTVKGTVLVDGRTSVVFERVHGPSMWQQILESPAEAQPMAVELANIHRSLLSIAVPAGVPDLVDRLTRKAQAAERLPAQDRDEAAALIGALPRGAALLHGDLHPGNVLMGPGGPVVIDWFDAAIGHPIADIVRSSILMQPPQSAAPIHLPDASSAVLADVHTAYLNQFASELDRCDQLAAWHAVVAAGRLAERAEVDEGRLVALWARRSVDQLA